MGDQKITLNAKLRMICYWNKGFNM